MIQLKCPYCKKPTEINSTFLETSNSQHHINQYCAAEPYGCGQMYVVSIKAKIIYSKKYYKIINPDKMIVKRLRRRE